MHASLIASTLVILAPVATGMALVAYWLVLAVALWGIVIVVAVADRRQPRRQPFNLVQTAQQPGWKQVA
jgi:hypothetical protein